eukprot:GHVS01040824.1.p1 GENE.GHVS01040824.1~~GHVS01040824.1.p1  ORF type:complete len:334 (+),score=108.66 GHVS01040824.1:193-1194(+)
MSSSLPTTTTDMTCSGGDTTTSLDDLLGHLQLLIEQKKLASLRQTLGRELQQQQSGDSSKRNSLTRAEEDAVVRHDVVGGAISSPSSLHANSQGRLPSNNESTVSVIGHHGPTASSGGGKGGVSGSRVGSGGISGQQQHIPADANIKFPQCRSRVMVIAVDTSMFSKSMVLWLWKNGLVQTHDIVVLVTVWEKLMNTRNATTSMAISPSKTDQPTGPTTTESNNTICAQNSEALHRCRQFIHDFYRSFLSDCPSVIPFVVSATSLANVEVGRTLCATANAIGATMIIVGSRGLGETKSAETTTPTTPTPTTTTPTTTTTATRDFAISSCRYVI